MGSLSLGQLNFTFFTFFTFYHPSYKNIEMTRPKNIETAVRSCWLSDINIIISPFFGAS